MKTRFTTLTLAALATLSQGERGLGNEHQHYAAQRDRSAGNAELFAAAILLDGQAETDSAQEQQRGCDQEA